MPDDKPDIPAVYAQLKQTSLDQLAVGASFVADKAVMETVPNAELDLINRMQYQLRSYVLADHLVDDNYETRFTYEVPASWWQHFKQTYGHQWWLRRFVRRWPAKTATNSVSKIVHFDRYATYPDAKIRVPDLGPVYLMEHVTENEIRYGR